MYTNTPKASSTLLLGFAQGVLSAGIAVRRAALADGGIFFEHFHHSPPAEHGAFDACGHFGNVFERGGFVELFYVGCIRIAFYHVHKDVCEAERFGFVFSDNKVKHHVDRGLGNGAAASRKRAVGNRVVLIDLQTERNFVPAARIDAG